MLLQQGALTEAHTKKMELATDEEDGLDFWPAREPTGKSFYFGQRPPTHKGNSVGCDLWTAQPNKEMPLRRRNGPSNFQEIQRDTRFQP